jgi:hypothetical protein
VVPESFRLLLQGIDTIECAYYLRAHGACGIDFLRLTALREELRQAKVREPAVIDLGGAQFLLHPYGSSSGYPLVMSNADFHIQFGEFNNPSFFVKFLSGALWREGAFALHRRLLDWAESVGLFPVKEEGLSRVDWAHDYFLPQIDFDEDCFVSLASKDATYREDGKPQTFKFGIDDVVLRVYDKVAEIVQESGKTWFFKLWGCSEDVWRVEWQVRKAVLRRFGIRTFVDLEERQGDVLRYLASEHDTLRVPLEDSNRSRWLLHPLWVDLQERIKSLPGLGVYREIEEGSAMEERLIRIAMSVYGYLKRVGAIYQLKHGKDFVSREQAAAFLEHFIKKVHDPMSWKLDVEKRVGQMRLGQW